MTTCGNPTTHQTTEGHVPLCREHASQAKRDGALVEILPSQESGGRRKAGPPACEYVEPVDAATDPAEPSKEEEPDS